MAGCPQKLVVPANERQMLDIEACRDIGVCGSDSTEPQTAKSMHASRPVIVELEDERLGGKWNVTMVGEDVGSFDACNRVIELVMAKDAYVCTFHGSRDVYAHSLYAVSVR